MDACQNCGEDKATHYLNDLCFVCFSHQMHWVPLATRKPPLTASEDEPTVKTWAGLVYIPDGDSPPHECTHEACVIVNDDGPIWIILNNHEFELEKRITHWCHVVPPAGV